MITIISLGMEKNRNGSTNRRRFVQSQAGLRLYPYGIGGFLGLPLVRSPRS